MEKRKRPTPAATVVIFKCHNDEPEPQILMIERAYSMSFAAGALVFPGGKVDAQDAKTAKAEGYVRNAPDDFDDCIARIAAVRESIEEAGVSIGIYPRPSTHLIDRWRERLYLGHDFLSLITAESMVLDLADLVPFARWCPNFAGHHRFDTRFYISSASQDCQASADCREASKIAWMTAKHALSQAKKANYKIIFPTMRNLERIAHYQSFNSIREHLKTVALETVVPFVETRDGFEFVSINTSHGYPITTAPIEQVMGKS